MKYVSDVRRINIDRQEMNRLARLFRDFLDTLVAVPMRHSIKIEGVYNTETEQFN